MDTTEVVKIKNSLSKLQFSLKFKISSNYLQISKTYLMKNLIRFAFVFLFFFVGSVYSSAQQREQSWNAYMTALEESDKIFVSVAVSEKGKLLYSRAIGMRSIEGNLKSDESTVYHIGSISKSYTATIILQMVDEGRLSLNDKLAIYFSEIPNSENITIEQLLRHQSGLVNFTSLPDYTDYMLTSQSREQMLERFVANGIEFKEGTQTSYSNTNYVLLSFIAEDIDKSSFNEIVSNRIAKPLGLKRTYINNQIDVSKGEAESYVKIGKWTKSTETHSSIPLGAGAIQTTPTELNIFYQNVFHSNLLTEASLARMTEIKEGFGLGLFTFPFNGRTAYGHTGGIDAFQSMAGHFREEQLTVSAITNGTEIELNDVMIALLSIYFGQDYEIPTFEKPIELDGSMAGIYQGVYSSSTFPLKITIGFKDGVLTAQATGQAEFPLEQTEKNVFEFKLAGIKMTFDTEKREMKFEQGGGVFILLKE
jgi:D-alanyl-D-alanine carboxypeptidase